MTHPLFSLICHANPRDFAFPYWRKFINRLALAIPTCIIVQVGSDMLYKFTCIKVLRPSATATPKINFCHLETPRCNYIFATWQVFMDRLLYVQLFISTSFIAAYAGGFAKDQKPASPPKCNCIELNSISFRYRHRCSLLLNAKNKNRLLCQFIHCCRQRYRYR